MKIEYHNLYTHLILTTEHRYPFISEKVRNRIEKYITGVVTNHQSRLYAIYANPEHVHMLISKAPNISDQHLATRIAESSEKFIIDNKLCKSNFRWQESCAAFSVSKSGVDSVCKYILNQPAHHQKFSFSDEYESFVRHYQQTL